MRRQHFSLMVNTRDYRTTPSPFRLPTIVIIDPFSSDFVFHVFGFSRPDYIFWLKHNTALVEQHRTHSPYLQGTDACHSFHTSCTTRAIVTELPPVVLFERIRGQLPSHLPCMIGGLPVHHAVCDENIPPVFTYTIEESPNSMDDGA